jgi:twitching motility protein PilT
MPRLDNLFRYAKEQGASDVHLTAGEVPRLRLNGVLTPVEGLGAPDDAKLLELLRELVDERQWTLYRAEGDLDFAYALEGVARFRSNFLRQERGAAAVFRLIPDKIKPLEELSMPEAIDELANLHSGLVLVTGPTGSGKSTTLAAIVDRINDTWPKHIVTIEDPVEFVHPEKRCVISQREVGSDTESFGAALRAAIRQDADVILVAELRDLETIALALSAAEMGSLVLGTLHTNSAAKTIDRLIDVFPARQQDQIRNSLGDSLAAVVSQHLMRTIDGSGRCAAIEILLRSKGLANLIREGNTPMVYSVMQSGRAQGMRTMDESLHELVRAGKVAADEAMRRAVEKQRFEVYLKDRPRAPTSTQATG